jgi:bacterioferritin
MLIGPVYPIFCRLYQLTVQQEAFMHERSIEMLNRAVADELAAVHQYMYFHFHCDDQGFDLLAGLFKRTAIQEMIHIEKLSERILFLGGDVEMVAAVPVKQIRDVKQMLELARSMEQESAAEYNQFAKEATANNDAASKLIFEGLIGDEERHYNQYDQEVRNIEKFGDRYLALQSMERSRNAASGIATE